MRFYLTQTAQNTQTFAALLTLAACYPARNIPEVPSTLNPQPSTLNPKPITFNPICNYENSFSIRLFRLGQVP